jgi:hypothetical protein
MNVFPQVLGGFGLQEVLTVDASKSFYQIGAVVDVDDVEIENEIDENMEGENEDLFIIIYF